MAEKSDWKDLKQIYSHIEALEIKSNPVEILCNL